MRSNVWRGMHFLCLAITGAAPAQAPAPANQIAWEPNFEAALEKAEKEGRPLFVAFIMDNEPANDSTVKQHYKDPEVLAFSRKMVCVVGNTGDHGSGDGPCPKFGAITCAQHQAAEIKARKRFMDSDVVRAPQHVFCKPTGEEVLRKVYLISEKELCKSMAYALSGKEGGEVHELVVEERNQVDQLLEDLESNNAEVRVAAFWGLARSDDERAVPALLKKAKPSSKKVVRYEAIRALGIKGNYKAVAPLIGFLRDKDARVLMLAAMALEKIELPDPVPELLVLLKKEKRDRVKACLLRTVATCLPEDEDVQQACLKAMRRPSKQLIDPCMIALFQLPPSSEIQAVVEPHIRAKNQNTRAIAVWLLGAQRQPELIPVIQKVANEDKSPEVRALATKAAAYCGGEDVPSYERLYASFYWEGENL